MKIYTHEATCSICGGDGLATAKGVWAEWVGGSLEHSDPRICAENLRQERIRLEKLRAKLEEEQR